MNMRLKFLLLYFLIAVPSGLVGGAELLVSPHLPGWSRSAAVVRQAHQPVAELVEAPVVRQAHQPWFGGANQPVGNRLVQRTVREELERIKESFGVRFVYDSGLGKRLDRNYEGTSVEGLTLEKALARILEDTGVKWEIRGGYVVLTQGAPARKRYTVCGYVTDEATGETLIGAGVTVAKLAEAADFPVTSASSATGEATGEVTGKTGTSTNNFGFYSLTLPEGEVELTYSYIGCASKAMRINLKKDITVNVALTPSAEIREARITARKDAGVRSTYLGAIEVPDELIANTPVVLGEKDVLKTLQMMPGVQSGNEGFSGIYVRGGGSDENLMLLDGTSLYNVSHLFGLLSVFTPEAVKKVTVYKGSFPARYGGRVSSVVDVRTNDGNSKKLSGSVTAGFLAEKFHLEGPLKNGNTTFSLSARGMHTFLFDRVIKWAGSPLNYAFYDINAKVSHSFSDRSRGWIGFYSGRDYFRYEDESKSSKRFYGSDYEPYTMIADSRNDLDLNWGNNVLSARWTYIFSNRLFADFTACGNLYRMRIHSVASDSEKSEIGETSFRSVSDYSSGILDAGLKADFDYTPSTNHLIKFGGEYVRHGYRPEITKSKVRDVNDSRVFADTTYSDAADRRVNGDEMSLYIEDDISVGGRLTVNPGVHLSLFDVRGRFYFCPEPRISAKFDITADWSAKAAYSRMSQYVHQLTSGTLDIPTDLWVPITAEIRPVTSDFFSAGAYFMGLKGWEFSLEGYFKKTDNVLEYVDGRLAFASSVNWEDNVAMGEGRACGLELYARKAVGKTTGTLAYTLSKAERIFRDGSINDGRWFPAQFDRRHVINACVNHRFNSRIDLTAAWTFMSGNCMTVPTRGSALVTPSGDDVAIDYVSGRNNYRLPPTHHLDVSVNFRKQKRHGERIWNFGIYNLYCAQNPSWCVYDAYEKEGEWKPAISKRSFLTFLPSFSYTFKF